MHVLKKVKDENQALLRNLKKLLGKPVISSKTLTSSPNYAKFLKKLGKIYKEDPKNEIFYFNGKKRSSKSQKSRRLERKRKMVGYENKFLIKAGHKLETPRTWMSALYYSSNLKKEPSTSSS